MARKRQISPSIWTSEQFCSLQDFGSRLLFIGLFSNADDEGRMKASPAHLKMLIFPADGISVENVKNWRDELSTSGLIIVYNVCDVEYLVLPKFSNHQFISKPYPSAIPEPFPNHSRTIPEVTNINIIKDTSIKNTTTELLIDNGIGDSNNSSGMWKTEVIGIGGELLSMPDVWFRAIESIKKRINAQTFSTWFSKMYLHGINGSVALLTVRSDYHLENAKGFEGMIRKTLYDVLGREYMIRFHVDTDPDGDVRFQEALDAICTAYDITVEDLMSDKRPQNLVNARRELCKGMMATGRFTVADLARRIDKHPTSITNLLAEKANVP